MKNLISVIFSILIITVLYSCGDTNSNQKEEDSNVDTKSTSEVEKTKIESTKLDIDVEFKTYQVSNAEDKLLVYEDNSEISIPANAFEYEDGTHFKGEATVKYREIVSPAEIISSQVNMRYDSAGVSNDFQTAGMFEIAAFGNGKELFLKEGKEISVTFGSRTSGNYGFYQYNDDQGGTWDYKSNSQAKKEETNDVEFNALKPTKLDQLNDIVIQIKADYNLFPELKVYKNIIWKYMGEKTPQEVGGIFSKKVTKSKLKKADKGNYLLEITTGNKTHKLMVAPAFSEKNYQDALNVYKENSSTNANAPVKRTKRISEMGMYNYDRVYKSPLSTKIMASFSIDNGGKLYDVENLSVFLITANNSVVIQYTEYTFKRFNFLKTEDNKLLAILPGGKVATLNAKDFKASVDGAKKEHKFILNESETVLNSVDELEEVIASL